MQRRELGAGGPMVGAIGLGCWSFAGSYGPTDEAESHRTLARSIELGVDFLDTSNAYGNGVSETVIGNFVKANPSHPFKIASKAGIRRDPQTGKRSFDNSPEHLREELEKSLRRLRTDHIDLYYIHRRDQSLPIEDVTATLAGFVEEGKIGGIGFSEIAPSSLRRAHAVHPVRAVQSEYSLWTRQAELGMIQACAELGVAFVPFSPLCRGMTGATAPDPATFGDADFRKNSPRFLAPNFPVNVAFFDVFRELAQDLGHHPISLGLAWVLHQGGHLIPIPGTRSPQHLEQCARGNEISLSADDLASIEAALPLGFAHGERYSAVQWPGVEQYC